jgi:hypothetical protein
LHFQPSAIFEMFSPFPSGQYFRQPQPSFPGHSGAENLELGFSQPGRLYLAILPSINSGKTDPQFPSEILLTQTKLLANFLYKGRVIVRFGDHKSFLP